MPESHSVEQLKTWHKCQKKYELQYVRQLQWPSNPKNFRLGKGVHQLLDYAARQLPLTPVLDATDQDILHLYQLLQSSRWAQLPIVASEWGFSINFNQHWIYGRIDRVVRDGDQIIILDWKTGTAIPSNPQTDWQTLIYLYAVMSAQRALNLTIAAEQLAFVYVQAKGNTITEVRIAYDAAMHQATQDRLLQTLNTLHATRLFALPAECPDRYCPYRNICGIETESPGQAVGAHG